jgi:tetratricopeptide (TPR) repeat protein
LRAEHPQIVAVVLNDVAIVLDQRGRFAEAKDGYERALALELAMPGGASHPRVGDTRVNLSITLLHLNDLDGARAQAECAVSIFTSVFDGDHPQLVRALDQLGTVLSGQDDLEGARRTYESALEMARRVHPPQHPDTARILANLGIVARHQGAPREARERYLQALDMQVGTVGPDHPDVGRTFAALGLAAAAEGDATGARRYFVRAPRIQLNARGPAHPETVELLRLAGLGEVNLTEQAQVQALLRELDRIIAATDIGRGETGLPGAPDTSAARDGNRDSSRLGAHRKRPLKRCKDLRGASGGLLLRAMRSGAQTLRQRMVASRLGRRDARRPESVEFVEREHISR